MEKHKKILSSLKRYYKEDDDIWDKELIDQIITEYFVVEEFKWNKKIKVDKNYPENNKHSLLVKTSIFWWIGKHLNRDIATTFAKEIYK